MGRPYELDQGVAADPSTRTCEWCELPAKIAYEVRTTQRKKIGTAQFLYVCWNHSEIGRESARADRPARTSHDG